MEKFFSLALESQKMLPDCHGSPVIDFLAQALFYEVFVNMGVGVGVKPQPHPNVDKAQQFILCNFHRTLSGQEIASSVGMSYQHLARLFRIAFGCTPMEMLWTIRIEQGAELLYSTGLSVAEIAIRVGFQDPFHFSKCIKKQFNFSPRELRDKLKSSS